MRHFKGILLALLAIAAACAVYLSVGYSPEPEARASLEGDSDVRVSRVDGVWRFDGPGETAGLVFYPGAKVDAVAYAPLMASLARAGLDSYLPEVPLRLALLGTSVARDIMGRYDHERWYLGGHSMGGVAAAMAAAARPEAVEGLILLGAYPDRDLPEEIKLLSVYGSRDAVLNRRRYEAARAHWPPDAREVVIEGGNHSGFGDYGAQRGDQTPTIAPEAQRAATVEAILDFCGIEAR